MVVATVPTACGIETLQQDNIESCTVSLQQYLPLAVLKLVLSTFICSSNIFVATVPTACGIETTHTHKTFGKSTVKLQQYLPLAVLKRLEPTQLIYYYKKLQQYLPLAVLKLSYKSLRT